MLGRLCKDSRAAQNGSKVRIHVRPVHQDIPLNLFSRIDTFIISHMTSGIRSDASLADDRPHAHPTIQHVKVRA
jgi:hypothetical protein